MSNSLRRHAKRLGYPEILLEPIVLHKRDPKTGETHTVYSDQARFGQKAGEKLEVLFHHYRLPVDDPTSMKCLVMRLAEDWIPGFETIRAPRRKKGAGKKHTPAALLDFVAQIDAIMKVDLTKRKNKLTPACRQFQKQQKPGSVWRCQTEKWLADLYRDTKKVESSLRSEISSNDTAAHPEDWKAIIQALSQVLAPWAVKKTSG
jgi:hypothetical protein